MCFYVSTIRKVEILSMNADFYVDLNEKVWFYYAKDIIWRHRKQSNFEIDQEKHIKIEHQKLKE